MILYLIFVFIGIIGIYGAWLLYEYIKFEAMIYSIQKKVKEKSMNRVNRRKW